MAIPWHSAISGRTPPVLKVFPTSSITGIWKSAFQKAIADFNSFKLNVSLVESNLPPDEQVLAGSDISFQAASGQQSFKFMGDVHTTVGKDKDPITIGGNSIEGLTVKVGQGGIQRAYIYVPVIPMSLGPHRPVSEDVMVFIAVHEFLHAVGLQNADHSPDNNADTFMGPPFTTPVLETNTADPTKDKVSNGRSLPQKRTFPPNKVTARTINLVQSVWP